METVQNTTTAHYYGDIIRAIFVFAGIVILLGFPTVTQVLGVPVVFVVLGIIILGLASGITNPVQKSSLVLNVAVSFAGLISFIFFTTRMKELSVGGFILLVNQILAVAFLLSAYFSVKSLRGFLLKK